MYCIILLLIRWFICKCILVAQERAYNIESRNNFYRTLQNSVFQSSSSVLLCSYLFRKCSTCHAFLLFGVQQLTHGTNIYTVCTLFTGTVVTTYKQCYGVGAAARRWAFFFFLLKKLVGFYNSAAKECSEVKKFDKYFSH